MCAQVRESRRRGGIADLNLENAQKVASSIIAAGGKALAVAMDVTNEEAVNSGIERAVQSWAASTCSCRMRVSRSSLPIEEYAFSDWKKMLVIHLDGAFDTTKAAIKHMYAGGKGGSIVYMGSVHSHEASKLKSA